MPCMILFHLLARVYSLLSLLVSLLSEPLACFRICGFMVFILVNYTSPIGRASLEGLRIF